LGGWPRGGAGSRRRRGEGARGPVEPLSGDALIGGAIVKQSVLGIAGATSEDTSFFGALIVFAILARTGGPVLGGTYRGVRAQRRRFRAAMRGRYGRYR
jgi:hypothetical protein